MIRYRALVKILVLVPLAVLSSWYAIGPGGLVSHSPATRLGVHAVLAFWLSISCALVLLAYSRKKQRSNILMLAALVFSTTIHIGSAVKIEIVGDQNLVVINKWIFQGVKVYEKHDCTEKYDYKNDCLFVSLHHRGSDISSRT